MNLITPQTGKNGKLVNKVFITEAYDISKEYYVAITLDREKKKDVFMVSTEGGVNIEEVAKVKPFFFSIKNSSELFRLTPVKPSFTD